MKEPVFEAFYNFKVSKSQEDIILIVMISPTFNIPMHKGFPRIQKTQYALVQKIVGISSING